MPHITYIQSKLSNKENKFVNVIQNTIVANCDRSVFIIYRNIADKRIYRLALFNKKGGISYKLIRFDDSFETPIKENKPNTFMNEEFFNNKEIFGILNDAKILGFFINDKNKPTLEIDANDTITLESMGIIPNKDIEWDKHQDISSIHYTSLLSLIRSYKESGDEKFYKKILALMGEEE